MAGAGRRDYTGPDMDLSRFRAVLLDLDGTLYHEEHPLPGSATLVARLQQTGQPFACLSNSTTSPQRVSQRLERMGMRVDSGHIYTAAAAAVDYAIERFGKGARCFNLATEGVQDLLEGRAHVVESADEPCDAIIVGATTNVYANEPRQRMALRLARNGALIVGICADRVYPSARGLEFGTGAFCSYLGYAANSKPFYCGKPLPIFFNKLCDMLQTPPGECVLIGDNLESDVLGAKGVGMKTILTLTGVATRADVECLPPDQRPEAIINDLTELC